MATERKKLVVLTGAGISAESGLRTFRDMNGLWEEYNVEDVASPEGWQRDPELVLRFYNERRRQLKNAEPNEGHRILAELEQHFDTIVITQNVDNLHERAGSTNVIHLHGKLTEVRSTQNPNLIYTAEGDVNLGDKCELGSQLRPNIVWFGEAVPAMELAIDIASDADIFAVVGTSLNVYPAASLYRYAPRETPIYLIDPNNDVTVSSIGNRVTYIHEKASTGVAKMKDILLQKYC
jgi:NAD-dependent deacetylase